MFRPILIFLVAIFLSLHAYAGDAPAVPAWTPEMVAGSTLTLDDPAAVEQLTFTAGGNVLATYGTKGGPLTGPVLQWRIADGRLQLLNQGKVQDELALVSSTPTLVTARRKSGQIVHYRIERK